jgi:hypothetical protein
VAPFPKLSGKNTGLSGEMAFLGNGIYENIYRNSLILLWNEDSKNRYL